MNTNEQFKSTCTPSTKIYAYDRVDPMLNANSVTIMKIACFTNWFQSNTKCNCLIFTIHACLHSHKSKSNIFLPHFCKKKNPCLYVHKWASIFLRCQLLYPPLISVFCGGLGEIKWYLISIFKISWIYFCLGLMESIIFLWFPHAFNKHSDLHKLPYRS